MSNFKPPKRIDSKEFGEEEYGAFLLYIEDKVKYIKAKCRGIREELMPKWVRIYRGIPSEKNKNWPWPGASNLIIQVAGTHSDELLSRVMSIYSTDPLFNVKPLGEFEDELPLGKSADDQAEDLEFFLQDCAYEPNELDLYRVEETGFSSAIRFGTGVFKFPWEYVTEQQATYIGGGTEEGTTVKYDLTGKITKRDGPHPENVPLSDWSIDMKWANLNLADFKIHTLHLDYYQLRDWKQHKDIYSSEAIDKILGHPDKIPEYRESLEEQKEAVKEEGKSSENYDIEECWFTYNKSGQIFRCVAYFHIATETHIGQIYNVYPENEEPFEDAKLAYDDDTYFGYGFCEMLEAYQREVSETHNWRVDNRRFATTGVGRVNKNSKLSSILQLYPGVLIPADENEIEAMNFGQYAMAHDTTDEQLTLSLAAQRSGVDPATGGSGGGTVNPKKGTYSAQGTAMSMQSQNNRNNLRMSDMRSCHVRMGRKILRMYAYFGLGDKIRKYGKRAEKIRLALENYKSGKLGLVIEPSTASQNREMEKQNEILLSTTLERLYQGDLLLMQTIINPATPPGLKDLMMKQLKAKNALMKSLIRNFGRRDTNRLLAVPDFLTQERPNAIAGQQSNTNGAVINQASQQQLPVTGMVPGGAGAVTGAVPVQ